MKNYYHVVVAAVLFVAAMPAVYYVGKHHPTIELEQKQQFGRMSFAASPGAGQTVYITATDATGRTRTVTASRVDPFVWDAGNVTIHFVTDQYMCSGFEP